VDPWKSTKSLPNLDLAIATVDHWKYCSIRGMADTTWETGGFIEVSPYI